MIAQKLLPLLRTGLLAAALATPVAATAQQAPADRQDEALAHAQCMRDNGYAEFPDPTPDGGVRFQITPETASRFHKAADACRHLAPEGMRDEEMTPEEIDGLIKLSQCVRDNGLPEFPDPGPAGNFDLSATGIGPGDARLEAAMDVCRKAGLGQGGRIMIGG